MRRQKHEIRFPAPITTVFPVLVGVLARGRWAGAVAHGLRVQSGLPPDPGESYEAQRGTVLRRGRVLECLRPVAITLEETLHDPPCRVTLMLRWRLEPMDDGALTRLEARYVLRGAAPLRRRHWDGRIRAHCERMLAALQAGVRTILDQPPTGTSGQTQGSTTMTVKKTISVSGTPSFR
jgi:hypothetical protein